jgi:hypothetical protein
VWRGSKLRRGSTVDPSRSGPLDYSRDRLSGSREKSVQGLVTRNRDITIRDISTTTRTVWGHRSRQVDRWHIACRDLVSGRAENLVSRVAKREDTKQRSGERTRSRPSEEDRWQRSRDLANSGVRRVKAQVLGTPSHEAAKWRED